MTTLKFDLDVIASTCIRRKKPWPRLAIVGEVRLASLVKCLMLTARGSNRYSVNDFSFLALAIVGDVRLASLCWTLLQGSSRYER